MGDHTEAVSIDYDPELISFEDLLQTFWASHRADYNNARRQYLHAVFFRDENQRRGAEQSVEKLKASGQKVETEILPVVQFTYAEGYHQKYYLTQIPKLRAFLEATYPDGKSFADSTVAMRLNAILFSEKGEATEQLRGEIGEYGLPEELEQMVRERLVRS